MDDKRIYMPPLKYSNSLDKKVQMQALTPLRLEACWADELKYGFQKQGTS
jgi:hypothetical protein